jgi:diguanylate cyclase (GGDEF)-like protein
MDGKSAMANAEDAGRGVGFAIRMIAGLGLLVGVGGGLVAVLDPGAHAVWQTLLGLALAVPLLGPVAIAIATGLERGAWVAVTTGFALTIVAGKLGMPGGEGLPAQSWSAAYVLWLVRFPVLYGGLAVLVVARSPAFGLRQVLDGLVGGFAAAALGALLVVPWLTAGARPDETTVTVHALVPLLDVFAAGCLIGAGVLNAWPPAIWLPLALDMALFVTCELIDTHSALIHPSLLVGFSTYPGYLVSAWLVALAVLGLLRCPGRPQPGRRPIAPPLLLAACAVATLVTVSATHRRALVVSLAAASLFATLVRQALTLKDNDQLLTATTVEAATDALTGIANRRSLEIDLRAAAAGATIMRPTVLALFDLDGFKHYNDMFGHPAGDALLRRLAARLVEAIGPGGRAYRMGGDEFCVLAPGANQRELIDRARAALADRGEAFAITASGGAATLPLDSPDPIDALRLADQRMYAHKEFGRRRAADPGAVSALVQIVRERDPALGEHTHDVASWAAAVASAMGATRETVEQTRLGGELHDIGKLSIPDAILNKPGPLDDREWEFMRRHTVIGERILLAHRTLAHVAPVARSHHERWDGGGYPDGLVGDQIPFAARVVAVCDSYHAIVADRPYATRRSSAEALDELARCRGTQFDPAVVDTFVTVILQSPKEGQNVA